jgi:BirA family biotin operon repressor/biotin-[acetyl-CoA-carboxylase] ligase
MPDSSPPQIHVEDLARRGGEIGEFVYPLRSVFSFDRLDSTNTWAIVNSPSIADDQIPALVICRQQTGGRGRLGRTWHADQGTLTFSLLDSAARMGLAGDRLPLIGLVAGLAVAEAIESTAAPLRAMVKWPNDVHLNGKKVAGILVEGLGTEQPRLVIGIGVNITTDLDGLDADVREKATSIRETGGREVDSVELIAWILSRMHDHLTRLGQQGFETLRQQLNDRCALRGRPVVLQQGGRTISGKCLGIGSQGEILIVTGGAVHSFCSGQIVRWG